MVPTALPVMSLLARPETVVVNAAAIDFDFEFEFEFDHFVPCAFTHCMSMDLMDGHCNYLL
jgi:hypothetical protein